VKLPPNFALDRDGHILGHQNVDVRLEGRIVTPERWMRVKEVFHAAVEHAPGGRAAYLSAACGDDAPLRAEVERLLNAHEEAATFIDQPAVKTPTLTGRVIGRYEIGRLLGVGGMGEVYAAKDLDLGRTVAIKVGIASDADTHARLKREAQHASRLNHPNICTIHEVGIHDNQPFIVMELVEGEPLSHIIPAGGLPAEDVVRYGRQIADALAHAHHGGVTHRDLKSANVLIMRDGRAKVLDFGLARALSRETLNDLSQSGSSITAEGNVAGTLSVMAPEMLRGEPADERSDIWSLGVLLCEMASGQRPFRGATGFELSGAILHAPPAPLPERVPHALARVAYRCLEKNPQDRYQTGGDVRAALESERHEPAPVRRMPAFVSKYRLPVVVASLLLAFAAFHFLGRRNTEPVAVGASGRPAIAVMHFQNAGAPNSNSAWLSSGVPNMLVTGLAQTRGLEIVSERRLLEALGQGGETNLSALDRTEAAEVARRAGAGAIVFGSIFHAGPEIRIDAQVEDLASGRVLGAQTVRGTDVFALVDKLSSDIRGVIGLEDAQVRNVANVSSTSLEAYRLYSEAVNAASNVRMMDAEKLFKAAIAIDPSFAEAYLHLSHVSGHLGRKAERDQYFKMAVEHADRLSERNRLMLDMELARERGQSDEGKRMLDELIAKYPDTEEAYALALQIYQRGDLTARDQNRLLEITAAGAAALPASSHTRNSHGYALLGAGRYEEAAREFEAYARIAPREPNPHDSLGEAYLKAGDATKAAAAYARALAVDPTFPSSRTLHAWSLAVLGRYDEALAGPIESPAFKAMILSRVGRYRDAAQVLDEGEKGAIARSLPTRVAGLKMVSALLALERGDHARALRDIPAAGKFFTSEPESARQIVKVSEHLMLGLAYIQAGRLADAASQYEVQGRIYKGANEVERSWRRMLEAEIALARGNLQQATAAFSASEPARRMFDANFTGTSVLFNDLPSRDGPARVALQRGDADGAIRIYRDLLNYGPHSKWVAPYEPLYVLQIARLLEKKGDRKAALTEYQRFLTFWKNADTDLPELTEAKRVVARLNP
jgi:tetratricopeptide (TPR) repeat protein/TolB-like protein